MRAEGFAKTLWFLFVCVFCWPFLGAADRAASVFGIPSLLVYLFAAWAVLIGVLFAVGRKLEE